MSSEFKRPFYTNKWFTMTFIIILSISVFTVFTEMPYIESLMEVMGLFMNGRMGGRTDGRADGRTERWAYELTND